MGIKVVSGEEDLILATAGGTLIRTDVSAIRVAGRATQGVIVMRFKDDSDRVIAMALAEKAAEGPDGAAEGAEGPAISPETGETSGGEA